LIKDTFDAKAVFERYSDKGKIKVCSNLQKLGDFLYMYLKKRFGYQNVIAEWGYNIVEACKKHGFESVDCQLFYDILRGDVWEDVYFTLQQSTQTLHNKIQRAEIEQNKDKYRGFLHRDILIKCIRKNWPRKTQGQIDALIAVINAYLGPRK
jgi:hypothetical protein